MKKILSILLIIIMIVQMSYIGAFATNGVKEVAPITEPETGEAYFDVDYPQVGKKMTVFIKDKETQEFNYRWYINNKNINNSSSSYTPVTSDLEKTITVKILDKNLKQIASKNVFMSNLPVVYIETENRENITSKEKELNAKIDIQGNAKYNSEDILYHGETKIKGRGNTTWNDAKKPYKLKLDSKADLFGMGKNKHWVLISNPFDESKIKNTVAYNLSGELGMTYMQSVPVELILNGRCVGTYTLCEHIRIGETRVDITDWDDIAEDAAKAIYKSNTDKITKTQRDELIDIMTDNLSWTTSGTITYNGVTYKVSDYYAVPSINGGYLLSIDRESDYTSKKGLLLDISKPEGYSKDMYNNITGYFQAFEDALFSDDFCTEYNGKKVRYTDFIDVESFAKAFLVNEFFKNTDFGFRSTYMYKDIDGKLIAGPVWDFDLSSTYKTTRDYNSWKAVMKNINARMCLDPYFIKEVYKVYWDYRYNSLLNIASEGGMIDTLSNEIRESAYNDEALWDYDTDFDSSVAEFKQWVKYRLSWLDDRFANVNELYSSLNKAASNYFKFKNTTTSLSISADISGNVTVDFGDNIPKKAQIFVNGILKNTVDVSSSSISFNSGSKDCIVTVLGIGSDGSVISGGYVNIENKITSLEIINAPKKLSYNSDEKINTDSLILKATHSDGSISYPENYSVYSYDKNKVGLSDYAYDRIISGTQSATVAVCCSNAIVKYDVSVNPSDDYASVINMIDSIPVENFSEYSIRSIIEAQLAYNNLSETAKKQVTDYSRLVKAMDYIGKTFVTDNTGVVTCWIDDIIQPNLKNKYVLLIKGDTYKLRFIDSRSNTITIVPGSANSPVSKQSLGDYTLWTCDIMPNDYTIYTYLPNNLKSNNYIFNLNNFKSNSYIIKNINCKNSVFKGESLTLSFDKNKSVANFILLDNGTKVEDYSFGTNEKCSISISPATYGNHHYTLKYASGSYYVKCAEFDVFVYEKPDIISTNIVTEGIGTATKSFTANKGDKVIISARPTEYVTFFTGWYKDKKLISTEKDYPLEINDNTTITAKFDEIIFGDINCDEKINSLDALMVIEHSAMQTILTGDDFIRADVTKDKKVNSTDALRILQYSIGQIKNFD